MEGVVKVHYSTRADPAKYKPEEGGSNKEHIEPKSSWRDWATKYSRLKSIRAKLVWGKL